MDPRASRGVPLATEGVTTRRSSVVESSDATRGDRDVEAREGRERRLGLGLEGFSENAQGVFFEPVIGGHLRIAQEEPDLWTLEPFSPRHREERRGTQS